MTPNSIRKMLKEIGLYQIESPHPRSIGGGGFGDFSVKYQTNTTYKSFGRGYKTRQKSVRTGKIEIEVKRFPTSGFENVISKITSLLTSMDVHFEITNERYFVI